MTRLRTIAACHASAARDLSPWSQAYEDKATAAWRAVMSLTPEAARQEQRAIAEMIERLEWLREPKEQSYD